MLQLTIVTVDVGALYVIMIVAFLEWQHMHMCLAWCCSACNHWWNISTVDLACVFPYLYTEVCWLVANLSQLAGQSSSQTSCCPLPGVLGWQHSL